ncbi:molybdenum ABC transporter permease subunit [Saccharomonospora piscinae]|uniref:Molybdenum transport system permease n=1 Tax=Saccharomonospora piscinae TaxID=687388 RepID=A0A1V9A6F4_SACPI|nr:ABC transporter permease [Saccharomonospora piscinae]OQO92715.1 molybdenum ABC transporter permease subunit [Saccharomonospora piscinae]TLW91575.1 molybdate ABC transporter permease subunit [Saccharomonospora piscinae]
MAARAERGSREVATGVPRVLWLPAAVALALVVLPVVGLLARTDLTRLPALLTTPASLNALRLSLLTATLSTLACVVLGVPLAVVLARSTARGVRLLRAVVLLPLVLPPVVGGLALLFLFGRNGFLGYLLDVVAGVRVPLTTGAVVLAQTFVAMPFLVVSLEGALRGSGDRYERVAATLGARPWTVFRRVTLPLLLPALGSGVVLSFARALGEFGATITFAGSLEGVTRTLPLEVYHQVEVDVDSAVAMALLLVVVAVLVIAVARPRALEGVRS